MLKRESAFLKIKIRAKPVREKKNHKASQFLAHSNRPPTRNKFLYSFLNFLNFLEFFTLSSISRLIYDLKKMKYSLRGVHIWSA